MASATAFSDVMFDLEPIGLAEAFADLDTPVSILLETDSEPEAGSMIYFGLATSASDIMETKARVLAVSSYEDGFRVSVEVLAVDAAMKTQALTCLTGGGADTNAPGLQPVWAFGLKQTTGAYAMLVNSPAGVLTAPQISKMGELAARGAGLAKITHAQRMILLMPLEQMEDARTELASVGLQVGVLHKGVRNIRACSGALCRFAQGLDAITLAIALDKALFGRGTQFDVKVAVSDCMRNCSESYCCDIGLIGTANGYRMVVGGRGSQVPFRAIQVADRLTSEAVPVAVLEAVQWYEKHANENERFWKLLQRLGEPEAAKRDLSAMKMALEGLGDGVDETSRLRDHMARLAGAGIMKTQLGF